MFYELFVEEKNMTRLSVSEFRKRPWRIDLLKNKIQKKESLTTFDNKKVTIIDSNFLKSLDATNPDLLEPYGGRNPIKIKTTNGEIALNQLGKTKEFGGGGGSGGGAQSTAINESAQCLYASLAFNVKKKKITAEDLTPENLKKAFRFISIGKTSLDQIMSIGDDWVQGSILGANILFDNFYSDRNMYFHRDSKFMNSIYNAKSKAFKKSYGANVQNDKWNPGDIWMTSSNNIKFVDNNLYELNDQIRDLFIKKQLVGISLKKMIGNAKIKVYNFDKSSDVYKYQGYNLGSRGFFNSIDNYILTSDGKIQTRAFSEDSSWQAEIKAKHAAGGKMSLGPINMLLKELKLKTLPEGKKITSIARKPDKKFYQEFYTLYKKYGDGSVDNINEFIKAVENTKKPNSFRFSKFMSIKFLDIIESNKTKSDDIIAGMFKYASSSSDFSSVFVKIY